MNKILTRILQEAGVPELLEVLAERLSPTDLQSLLLEVYRRRAQRVTPAGLMRRYEHNRFVQPAEVRPQQMLAFEQLAYSLLPAGFETIELSPVCPLGASSALSTVDQNWVVTTVRNTEVCADSTSVLALECARRRRETYRQQVRPLKETRLCASQRVLRAQVFEGAASFAHFRLLSLCTADRDRGAYRFEVEALVEQLRFYIKLIESAQTQGYELESVRVTLTAFNLAMFEALESGVLLPLAAEFPDVAFGFDQAREAGRGYYVGAGLQVHAQDLAGTEYFLVDGGFTDWTQRLLSNRKERLLTSGMGSERFLFCFGP
jgi:hypothetical protein